MDTAVTSVASAQGVVLVVRKNESRGRPGAGHRLLAYSCGGGLHQHHQREKGQGARARRAARGQQHNCCTPPLPSGGRLSPDGEGVSSEWQNSRRRLRRTRQRLADANLVLVVLLIARPNTC